MNNLEAELEELRPQLEVIVLSVKLLGPVTRITETMAAGNAATALNLEIKDAELRLAYARAAISWWKK